MKKTREKNVGVLAEGFSWRVTQPVSNHDRQGCEMHIFSI